MFQVKIDTSGIQADKGRNRDAKLRNDFYSAIHNKVYRCKTEQELLDRLAFIAGCENGRELSDFVALDGLDYGRKLLPVRMYGFLPCSMDFDKVLMNVRANGSESIPFAEFYETRQQANVAGGFIEVTKI